MINPLVLRDDVRKTLLALFKKHLTMSDVVYDIGCGNKPFAPVLKNMVREHIGVDIEDGFYCKDSIDIIGSAYEVPVQDEVADAVISSQVIEHLENPEKAIKETSRILKKGGTFFLSFPFLYPTHAEPYDYYRYTEYLMDGLLNRCGFEVQSKERVAGFWYLTGFFMALYFQGVNKGIIRRLKVISAFTWIVKMFFYALHCLEGSVCSLLKKDVNVYRKRWTINYIYVATKR